MGLPSPNSPVKAAVCMRFPTKIIGERLLCSKTQAVAAANPKQWCEAQDFALLVCALAGGPANARHLAATCKALYQGICEAWDDLTRHFPLRLYVVGGLNKSFREVSTAWRLDTSHGQGIWETLPPLGHNTAGAATAVEGGRLYIFGGECAGRALRGVLRYDPLIGCWETLAPMQEGRIRPAAVFSCGYMYLLGGLDATTPLNTAERFDTKNGTWEELHPMHRPRYAGAAAAQPNGRVMAFGGELTDAGHASSIERYDPETKVWELLPSVRSPSCGAAVALTSSGRIAYNVGGLGLSGQALQQVEQLPLGVALEEAAAASQRFQPPLWCSAPVMPTARHLASAAGFRGGAVVVGGKGPTFEAISSVEVFDADNRVWDSLPPLPSPRIRAAVASGRF